MSDSFLLSTLNFSIRGCWRSAAAAVHDSILVDKDGKCQFVVGTCWNWTQQGWTQKAKVKAWWRRGLRGAWLKFGQGESLCQGTSAYGPCPPCPKTWPLSRGALGAFFTDAPWTERSSSTDPPFLLPQHSFQTTKICWENYLFLLSHPLVPRQGQRLKHSLALLSCFSSLTPVWSMDGIRILETLVLGTDEKQRGDDFLFWLFPFLLLLSPAS